jgi:cephalosporin hydroxylase
VPEAPFANQPPLWRRLPSAVTGRVLRSRPGRKVAARLFHRAYYEAQESWMDSRWLGVDALKTPQDLWVYQEIVVETRPDVIIETGTFRGGSALYLATVCDALDHGRIVSIDLRLPPGRPDHDRIDYLEGSSVDPRVVDRVRARVGDGERVMVLLDSDHSRDHVLAELRAYGPLVSDGCYLIVEDTNVNGHPVVPHWGPGPMEAVEAYLTEGAPFTIDPQREKFLFTFNPRGFLRRGARVRPAETPDRH